MTQKLQKKLANIFSLILNPIFLILLLVLLGIEKSNLSQAYLIIFTIFALFLNGLLPACIIFFLSKKGLVIDDVLDNKEVLKNRPFLLAWGMIILLVEVMAAYLLKKPEPLFAILLSLLFLIFMLFLISIYRKISLHTALITALSLITLFLFGYSFWPVLFLILIIAWSRLVLKRHTKKQIFVGFLVALLIVFIVFYFFKIYIPTS